MRPLSLARVVVSLVALLCGVAAAQTTAPMRVGGSIKQPTRIKSVDPVYPDDAMKARVQGVVILECVISPSGDVESARVLRSVPMLDQAALDAVKQWQYTPTLLNGVAVPVIMTVTVNFALQPESLAGGDPGPPRPSMGPNVIRALSEEEASREPFLLAFGRAGVLQLGLPIDDLYRRIPVAQTRLVDLREEGSFTPAIEIRLDPAAKQPAIRALYRSLGATWAVFALEVTDPRFRTVDGLGVGSTLAEIRAVAPTVQPVSSEHGTVVQLRDRAMFFWLDAGAGPVPDTAVVKRVSLRATIPRARP